MVEPPELTRKLEAEMVFLTLPLPHLGQWISSGTCEVVRISKRLLTCSQRYSYIGMVFSNVVAAVPASNYLIDKIPIGMVLVKEW
jgi:uncharacterized membrane protein